MFLKPKFSNKWLVITWNHCKKEMFGRWEQRFQKILSKTKFFKGQSSDLFALTASRQVHPLKDCGAWIFFKMNVDMGRTVCYDLAVIISWPCIIIKKNYWPDEVYYCGGVSKICMDAINGDDLDRPWKIDSLCCDLNMHSLCFNSYFFCWVRREANYVAYSLTKFAVYQKLSFCCKKSSLLPSFFEAWLSDNLCVCISAFSKWNFLYDEFGEINFVFSIYQQKKKNDCIYAIEHLLKKVILKKVNIVSQHISLRCKY